MITESNPLVSVLMTSFNREKYIAEAIESVLKSTYKNFELIIVDDCSDDTTVQIAHEYEKKDPRIKVFINEINLGDYPNRNRAASYAKGLFLKYLDADDTIYKYSLNYMVQAMLQYPEAAMAISSILIDDSKPYPHISLPVESYTAEFFGKSVLSCGPSAAIIRKDVFDSMGGFSGKQFIGDHELWLKIASEYSIIKLQPALVWWRQHPAQQIVQEGKDITVQNIRYQNSLETLSKSKQFFDEEKYLKAKKNVKKKYARAILRTAIRHKAIFKGYTLWKMSRLTFSELLSGLK